MTTENPSNLNSSRECKQCLRIHIQNFCKGKLCSIVSSQFRMMFHEGMGIFLRPGSQSPIPGIKLFYSP